MKDDEEERNGWLQRHGSGRTRMKIDPLSLEYKTSGNVNIITYFGLNTDIKVTMHVLIAK